MKTKTIIRKLKQIFSDYLKHKEINYLIKDTFEYLKLKKRYLNNKYLLKLFEDSEVKLEGCSACINKRVKPINPTTYAQWCPHPTDWAVFVYYQISMALIHEDLK